MSSARCATSSIGFIPRPRTRLPSCRSTSASARYRGSATCSSATTARSSPRRSWGSRASRGTSRSSTTSLSPCRVEKLGGFEPIERKEWVPDEHRPLHLKTWDVDAGGDALSGRQLLMWNDDVEISLCRPTELMDWLLPERRRRRGDLRPRRLGHGRVDLRRASVQARRLRRDSARHDVPVHARRRRAALCRLRVTGANRDPAPLPQRVRATAGACAVLPPRHPSADRAEHAPRARRVPRQGARARRLPDLRPRLPPLRRRRLGRLRLSVDVLDPRLRADHRAYPHAAAVAPDLPGAELRHLLVLSAQARLRPAWRSRFRITTRT